MNHLQQENVDELINAWQQFLKNNIWENLIKGIGQKPSGCGIIYELGNPLNRPHEDFAIADMRYIAFTEPHYHGTNEYEIFFVLQGKALYVVGHDEIFVQKGSVVIIPPNTAHFAIPDKQFVIGVTHTPPFEQSHYIVVSDNNEKVKFSRKQFDRLRLKNH